MPSEERREAAFREYLRTGDDRELRAAGEATNSSGGYTVPIGFSDKIAVAQKEFSTLYDDMEQFETESGQPDNYPAADFTGRIATLVTENAQVPAIADSNYSLITFGDAPTFGIREPVSFQLEADSGIPIHDFLAARLGESLGRGVIGYALQGSGTSGQPLGIYTGLGQLASAGTVGGAIAATGGYVTLSAARVAPTILNATGTELAQNVLAVETLSAMVNAIDPAYQGDACWYMSPIQWSNTLLLADSSKRPFATFTDGLGRDLMGFPVKIVNTIQPLSASTVGGPVFGSMRKAFIHRVVPGTSMVRSTEFGNGGTSGGADNLQAVYVAYQRHDMRMRDGRALVTVKAAGT